MWWNNADGRLANVPTDAYWAWGGVFDSLVFVIPSLDLVVVRTGVAWLQSTCSNRATQFCPDYGVLEEFIDPIVASVNTAVVITNAAPVVNAGTDATVDLASSSSVSLSGSAQDITLPAGPLTYNWSLFKGPGAAPTISTPASATHQRQFHGYRDLRIRTQCRRLGNHRL